jgi:hypothetical protein
MGKAARCARGEGAARDLGSSGDDGSVADITPSRVANKSPDPVLFAMTLVMTVSPCAEKRRAPVPVGGVRAKSGC